MVLTIIRSKSKTDEILIVGVSSNFLSLIVPDLNTFVITIGLSK